MDVMLQLKKEGLDFSDIILRRTAKTAHPLQASAPPGFFRPGRCSSAILTGHQHLVILLESFCFQLAFLDAFDVEGSKELVSNYLELLKPKHQRHFII